MTNNIKFYVEMGKDAAKVLGEYYGERLVKFIKGEPLAEGELGGKMYMGEIKEYYDKYGYTEFNDALMHLYKVRNGQKKEEAKSNE